MLPIILGAIAAPVAVVLLLASRKPDTFHVERSMLINAPAERIFPMIQDFQRWRDWSPYEGLDPALERTYSGADRGVGAVYAWKGNAKAGEGRMEIIEATDPAKVVIKLDFTKPFEAHNTAEFTLAPEGGATRVTWGMRGPNLFIGKVISVFGSMDKFVTADFEKGLTNLKRLAEA